MIYFVARGPKISWYQIINLDWDSMKYNRDYKEYLILVFMYVIPNIYIQFSQKWRKMSQTMVNLLKNILFFIICVMLVLYDINSFNINYSSWEEFFQCFTSRDKRSLLVCFYYLHAGSKRFWDIILKLYSLLSLLSLHCATFFTLTKHNDLSNNLSKIFS